MNKLISFFILVHSFGAYASKFDPNTIISNVVDQPLQQADGISCNDSNSELQVNARSCLREICGPNQNVKKVYLTPEDYDNIDFSNADKSFMNSKEAISKALKYNIKERIQILEELISRLEDDDTQKFKDFKLSESEMAEYIYGMVKPNLNVIIDEDTGSVEITRDDFEEETPGEKEAFNLVKNWISSRLETDIDLRIDLDVTITHADYVKRMSEQIKTIESMIKDRSQFHPAMMNQFDYIRNSLANMRHNPNSIPGIFRSQLKTINNIKRNVASTTKTAMPDSKTFCRSSECSVIISKRLQTKQLPQLKADLIRMKSGDKKVPELAKKCKSFYYAKDYNSQIRNKHNPQKIVQEFSNTLDKFVTKLSTRYSKESLQMLKQKVIHGTGLIAAGSSVGQRIETNADYFERTLHHFSTQKHKADLASKLTNINLLYSAMFPKDFITEHDRHCSGVENGVLIGDDFYNPVKNVLNISASSCEHPVSGNEIIAHELGHVFSAFIREDSASSKSKKEFLSDRSCVNDRVLIPSYSSMTRKDYPEDHFYSEEDMADYLRHIVFDDQKVIGNGSFSHCSGMPNYDDEKTFVNLDFIKNDPHTPPFFRMINSLIDKRVDIPSTCKAVLEKKNHLYSAKKCR